MIDAAELARLRRALEQARGEPDGCAEMKARAWLQKWLADYGEESEVGRAIATLLLTEAQGLNALRRLVFDRAAERDALRDRVAALEAALIKIRDNDPDGWEASIARAALKAAPASGHW